MTNDDERIRFTFRIPGRLYNKLRDIADDLGVSLNALILQILWNWVKENEKEDTK